MNNYTNHDSIDYYGRTLLDLKIYSSVQTAQTKRIYLRSLFGTYTNLTVNLSVCFRFDIIILHMDEKFNFSFIVHRIIMGSIVKDFVDQTNNITIVMFKQEKKFVNIIISDQIVLVVIIDFMSKNNKYSC